MDQPDGGAAAGGEVGALRQQLQQAQQQAWRAQDALNQVLAPRPAATLGTSCCCIEGERQTGVRV